MGTLVAPVENPLDLDNESEAFVVFDKNSKPGGLWVSNYPNAKGMLYVCTVWFSYFLSFSL